MQQAAKSQQRPATPAWADREVSRAHPPTAQHAAHEPYSGNQAMLRRLSRTSRQIQCKLQIGAVNDPLEAEADRVADQVMRMPEPREAKPLAVERILAHGSCEPEMDHPGEASPLIREVLAGPGQQLDRTMRADMEARLGHDFSRVRIHADAGAVRAARAINAIAFTVGRHIGFEEGRYSPGSADGRRLLAHELTHVLQQESAATTILQRQPRGQPPRPPWLSGVSSARFVEGNIWEITITGYGRTLVGPYNELTVRLSAESLGEQAHHIVGQEHLRMVTTGFTEANAPAVALETGLHQQVISARITAEQGYLGGRRGGRASASALEIADLYDQVYSFHTDFRELSRISRNILLLRGGAPAAGGVPPSPVPPPKRPRPGKPRAVPPGSITTEPKQPAEAKPEEGAEPRAEGPSGVLRPVAPAATVPRAAGPSASAGGSRPGAGIRVAAGGAAAFTLVTEYLRLAASYHELANAFRQYRNDFYRRIGGHGQAYMDYQGRTVTLYALPNKAGLQAYLDRHIQTWAQWVEFLRDASLAGLQVRNDRFVFVLGKDEKGKEYQPIDVDDAFEAFLGRLSAKEAQQIKERRQAGFRQLRFKSSVPRNKRRVWRAEAHGLRTLTTPLTEGADLPLNPTFFFFGTVTTLRGWGLLPRAYCIVEGADPQTREAMAGRGLVEAKDIEWLVKAP